MFIRPTRDITYEQLNRKLPGKLKGKLRISQFSSLSKYVRGKRIILCDIFLGKFERNGTLIDILKFDFTTFAKYRYCIINFVPQHLNASMGNLENSYEPSTTITAFRTIFHLVFQFQ